jgi:hypothetical protein
MTAQQTFADRIKTRLRLWWGQPPKRTERLQRYRPHALRERYARRRRDEPEDVWRCCEFWQRTLINKWNSREFAARHGGQVPALYWCARMPSAARLRRLPSAFVIRPLWGTSRHGVFVVAEGRDLLRGAAFSVSELHRSIRHAGTLAWTLPVMAEEFVRSEDGQYRLPIEYKCYTFGDTIGAVQVIERQGVRTARHGFYTPHWEAFEDAMNTELPPAARRDPPGCLDEMIALAARLGGAVGTFMRVDFFATEHGCVFNEFASTPGNGHRFTPFCNELFGALWEEKFPHAT